MRETWLGYTIETTLQDIRYAARGLVHSTGFTLTVIATLALAIGANLTMFGLLSAVLWKPLPYPNPDRILDIQVDARNMQGAGATLGEVLDLSQRSRTLEQVSMINGADANLEFAGQMQQVTAAAVSDNFFALLGVHPALGRLLNSNVDGAKDQVYEYKDHVLAIVISNELWQHRFSANPKIIGATVRVNNANVQVVGVLPPGFRVYLPPDEGAPEQVDIWFPSSLSPTRQYRGLAVAARLRPGFTLAQANAELQTLAAQFEREFPEYYSGRTGWQASPFDTAPRLTLRFTASLIHDQMTRDSRPALFLLTAAVAFVLLIACVNVANLMLARGASRQCELEIRRALGVSRLRILRQLLTESLLLATLSAAAGVFCADAGLTVLSHLSTSGIPLQSRITLDSSVILAALLLSLATCLLFGLLPAWRITSGDESSKALHAGRTQTSGASARTWQRGLVVAEVALSIVPLVCGGLMLRSFSNLLHAPLGFNPTNIVTAKIPFNLAKFAESEQRSALMRQVLDQVRAIPGVESVSAASPLPLDGQQTRRVGAIDQPDKEPNLAIQQGALPGYLNVVGTRLLKGRDFTDADLAGSQRRVTIIDERLAQRLWPSSNALGKQLVVYRTGHQNVMQVIGITNAVRATQVRDDAMPRFMIPDDYPSSLVIKTTQTAAQLTRALNSAIAAAHTGRAPFDIRPLSDLVSESIGDTRFILLVLSAFATVSVLLAAVGLYGTLAYLTAQRTREFGIRLALGSSIQTIVGIVVKESILLAIVGTVFGLAGVPPSPAPCARCSTKSAR